MDSYKEGVGQCAAQWLELGLEFKRSTVWPQTPDKNNLHNVLMSVIMQFVIMLNAIMLKVIYAQCYFAKVINALCHYIEYHSAKWPHAYYHSITINLTFFTCQK